MVAPIQSKIVAVPLHPPLVIDLDGTLLRSDLLLETGFVFLRQYPAKFFQPLCWLTKGKACLKDGLARTTNLDVTTLPYDAEVIKLIESAREAGRKVVLATASHHSLARRIADHLQLFDEVLASDAECNLSAHRKRDVLVELYGQQGFDYTGNSCDDFPAWRAARLAYVVNPSPGVERRCRILDNVEKVIRSNEAAVRDWVKALRLHQWLKNLLIFVPLLTAHRFTEAQLLLQSVLAFLFFGLCASSVYLLNDLLDLSDDRHHPTKRNRPFAAGCLPIKYGLTLFPLLLVAAFAGALCFLPIKFALVLAAYYSLTLAYSLVLKRRVVVDVITLAALYTLRIIAGAAATTIPLTFWILAFAMFIFLSLALVKRYAELRLARINGDKDKSCGRGYYPSDLEMISSLGAASGYMAVMVLAFYINETNTAALYRYPKFIWLACPLLLFWISRVWMLTHRGQMNDDPVVFAIHDRASLTVGILMILVFWMAT